MNVETTEQTTTASLDQFWKAVTIWNNKPHVVNRRLCGVLKVVFCRLVEPKDIENKALLFTIKNALNLTEITEVSAPWIIDKLSGAGITVMQLEENSKLAEEPGRYIYVKKLLPRVSDFYKPCLELVIKDTVSNTVTLMGLLDTDGKQTLTPNFPYHFQYMEKESEQKIQLVIEKCSRFDSSKEWLKKHLFNKIIKWAETAVVDDDNTSEGGVNLKSSLNLIDIISFNQLYQNLKKKYGSEMVQIWPEKTDPQKFVYEDVAIATYLILLWEEERQRYGIKEKQSFVDLGCGNGLLVHILSSEGHPGKGIDIRKRNIWSIYPESTKLEVQSITPSDDFLYPEADWLIGNHSDELTAWIPIIAARSSYKCKFFLLPCCPYELNGRKYQRIDSSRSQYEDYMHFLQDLCKVCGFEVRIDRLRIPSTKRTCLVGAERMYPEEEQEKIDESIKEYIQSRVKDKSEPQVKGTTSDICQNWSDSFQPRSAVERTRNCTQLDKGLVEDIMTCITEQLLVKKRLVTVTSSGGEKKIWNAGGTCTLSELAKHVPSEKLKKLKNECGGLKTLLKNHYRVFHVEGEVVSFRIPGQELSRPKVTNHVLKVKEKPCWFQCNHPDGCPLIDKDCTFKHE